MCPMLDVQQRHREVFRVRFGEKQGNRPVRLTDAIRVTSENPEIVDAFVDIYGGERKAWGDAWEAKLPTSFLRVVLLPGHSISQWWEKYKGSVCERRCDGQVEQKSGKACMCNPDPATRTANRNDCSPTTRVSVICPDVAVIGSGMFICHGLIGAETLPQSVQAAEAALALGFYVPAVVRVVEHKGQGTQFIVPQIELVGVAMNTMIEAAEHQAAIGGGGGRILGGPDALAAIGAPTAPTVRDQMRAVEAPAVPSQRKNAAEPIQPSGRTPRTADQFGDVDDAEVVEGEIVGEETRPTSPTGGPPAANPAAAGGPNRVAIACREAGLDDDQRHDLAEWASDGRTRSSKALTADEVARAIDGAQKLGSGAARLVRETDVDPDGQEVGPGKLVLRHGKFGWPTGPDAADAQHPATGSADPVTVEGHDLTWDALNAMKGPDLVEQCRELGLAVGGKVDEMRERIADHLNLGSEPF